jgi:hypothetical protein
MDTTIRDSRHQEVDNFEDEVYYRDVIGCTTEKDKVGNCATYNCGKGEVRICQKVDVEENYKFAEEVDSLNSYTDIC